MLWVPKARWTVDGKFWTSSGVTAGIDMAAELIRYFISKYVKDEKVAKETGDRILAVLEVR